MYCESRTAMGSMAVWCVYGERGLGVAVLDILGPLSPIWQARSLNGEVALVAPAHFPSRARAAISKKLRDAIMSFIPTPRGYVAITDTLN